MIIAASAHQLPLPDDSVQCVVTSPPYWGLRKYAGEQEIIWPGGERAAYGLEPTIEMYVDHTVQILREIRRVLRPDGVVFWNIGDSYANASKSGGGDPTIGVRNLGGERQPKLGVPPGLKPKDLCLIPERVAIAAQADGWWVRSMIIWAKPNPMPESCTDRPTDAYEHIIMLTKSERYFWDADAVREPQSALTLERFANGDSRKAGSKAEGREGQPTDYTPNAILPGGRNMRNVWTFPTQPYKGAHFATFPEEIPRRAILAATSERGACVTCGAPWKRITQKSTHFESGSGKAGNPPEGKNGSDYEQARSGEYDIRMGPVNEVKTVGWKPTCKCFPGIETRPCLVLDPFGGSGTTGRVATELNRRAILCDVAYGSASAEDVAAGRDYHQLADKRTRNVQRRLL